MATTSDGSTLIAIGGRSICAYDLAHARPESCSALQFNPASLQAIAPDVFLLNYPRADGMPVWLWEGRTGEVYFVPSGTLAGK